MYNHAWDPISGSALVDQPSLNPEAWSCCQKAGFVASRAYHLRTYHRTDLCHHRRLFKRSQHFFYHTECVQYEAQRGREGFCGINRLIAEAELQNSRCTATLCNLIIFSNTETLMLFLTNNMLVSNIKQVSLECVYGD